MIIRSLLLTILITICTGIIGLLIGYVYLNNDQPQWWFPEDLIHKRNFVAVGSMHNFGYLGGIIGLTAGVFYHLVQKRKHRKKFGPNKAATLT